MRALDCEHPWWKRMLDGIAETGPAAATASVFPYYLAVAHSVLPVAILRGPTRPNGRTSSIAVAGKDPWARYLPERIFLEPPTREAVRRLPVWSLARELQRLQFSVDLVVARVDALSARRFFGADFLHVPEWVGAWLDVPSGAEPRARATHSVRDDLRIVRKNGLQPRLSQRETDFEEFYWRMYVPFIRNRHGEFSHLGSYRRVRRAFRHGGLLWAERDGERIAGAVFEYGRDALHFRALGTAGGDAALTKRGSLAALYAFVVDHARQQRYRRVGLGTSRSLLQDGVLRYKKKWGAVLADSADTRFELLLAWSRLDGATLDLFSNTSPIFREPSGLSALHLLNAGRPGTSADAQEACDRLWIPGLHRLYLIHAAGWRADAAGPAGTILAASQDAGARLFNLGGSHG